MVEGRRKQATTLVSSGGRPIALRIRAIELKVVSGPSVGASAVLEQRQLMVGSAAVNDLVLSDPGASRFHFRIRAEDSGYRITDRGSTNGTSVNGVPIVEAYLADGARIEVGKSIIEVSYQSAESVVELSPEERFGDVIGSGVAMSEVFATARRVAETATTVLLLGETGTGKDLLARAIHRHSPRARAPFVVLDCGAVSAALIESELFGHVRGAFTGADADRAGVFERASGGTLFIDEIGELPLALQPKLLRALESRVVTRVGDSRDTPVDVRIIAATNRDLMAMIERDKFRADLYYRLAIVPIEIPPLRERPEDIPLIAGFLLHDILASQSIEVAPHRPHFSEAFGLLVGRPFPGNVRELRNVLERAAALADPEELAKHGFAMLVEIRTAIERTSRTRLPLDAARAQFDLEYLRDVLSSAKGDVTRAAETAEIHPKSFSRLMRRYGISKP